MTEREKLAKEKIIKEAVDAFGLIMAEFDTDPNASACFDRRIIQRAKESLKKLGELKGAL